MELVWSTRELSVSGRTIEKFPILLDDQMVGVGPANAFLRYQLLQSGSIESTKSWATYGQSLYDYFGFLQAHNLEWDTPGAASEYNAVGAYRDYALQEGLSRNTVRQRLSVVAAFYEYCVAEYGLRELPFKTKLARVPATSSLLAHTADSGQQATTRGILPKRKKNLPKFLAREQIDSLILAASNPHHRLLVGFALRTGLRRAELATFPCSYVVNPERIPPSRNYVRVHLDPSDGSGMKTKGAKPRRIRISRKLMGDLWRYLVHTRGVRGQGGSAATGPLLLNQDGKPYALDGLGISRLIAKLGERAGFKAWPHILRHTYATHTLNAMQATDKTLRPLIFLKRQLGHERIETTLIYAHLLDEIVDAAILAYDEEISTW